jgi:hypothetical protein
MQIQLGSRLSNSHGWSSKRCCVDGIGLSRAPFDSHAQGLKRHYRPKTRPIHSGSASEVQAMREGWRCRREVPNLGESSAWTSKHHNNEVSDGRYTMSNLGAAEIGGCHVSDSGPLRPCLLLAAGSSRSRCVLFGLEVYGVDDYIPSSLIIFHSQG